MFNKIIKIIILSAATLVPLTAFAQGDMQWREAKVLEIRAGLALLKEHRNDIDFIVTNRQGEEKTFEIIVTKAPCGTADGKLAFYHDMVDLEPERIPYVMFGCVVKTDTGISPEWVDGLEIHRDVIYRYSDYNFKKP